MFSFFFITRAAEFINKFLKFFEVIGVFEGFGPLFVYSNNIPKGVVVSRTLFISVKVIGLGLPSLSNT